MTIGKTLAAATLVAVLGTVTFAEDDEPTAADVEIAEALLLDAVPPERLREADRKAAKRLQDARDALAAASPDPKLSALARDLVAKAEAAAIEDLEVRTARVKLAAARKALDAARGEAACQAAERSVDDATAEKNHAEDRSIEVSRQLEVARRDFSDTRDGLEKTPKLAKALEDFDAAAGARRTVGRIRAGRAREELEGRFAKEEVARVAKKLDELRPLVERRLPPELVAVLPPARKAAPGAVARDAKPLTAADVDACLAPPAAKDPSRAPARRRLLAIAESLLLERATREKLDAAEKRVRERLDAASAALAKASPRSPLGMAALDVRQALDRATFTSFELLQQRRKLETAEKLLAGADTDAVRREAQQALDTARAAKNAAEDEDVAWVRTAMAALRRFEDSDDGSKPAKRVREALLVYRDFTWIRRGELRATREALYGAEEVALVEKKLDKARPLVVERLEPELAELVR